MRYMLLIYTDESLGATASEAEMQAVMAAYYAYDEATKAAGVHQLGEALNSVVTAKTVRVRNGKTLVTDGPYAETKEQLGGFYILECQDMQEAMLWVAKLPGARTGSIEVRPVLNFG